MLLDLDELFLYVDICVCFCVDVSAGGFRFHLFFVADAAQAGLIIDLKTNTGGPKNHAVQLWCVNFCVDSFSSYGVVLCSS